MCMCVPCLVKKHHGDGENVYAIYFISRKLMSVRFPPKCTHRGTSVIFVRTPLAGSLRLDVCQTTCGTVCKWHELMLLLLGEGTDLISF